MAGPQKVFAATPEAFRNGHEKSPIGSAGKADRARATVKNRLLPEVGCLSPYTGDLVPKVHSAGQATDTFQPDGCGIPSDQRVKLVEGSLTQTACQNRTVPANDFRKNLEIVFFLEETRLASLREFDPRGNFAPTPPCKTYKTGPLGLEKGEMLGRFLPLSQQTGRNRIKNG